MIIEAVNRRQSINWLAKLRCWLNSKEQATSEANVECFILLASL